MGHFVKIGKYRLNLDQITHLEEVSSTTACVHFAAPKLTSLELVDQSWLMLDNDDAKRLLLILDYYDGSPMPSDDYHAIGTQRQRTLAALEALDAPQVAEVEPEPEPVGQCGKCNGNLFWTDEDRVAVRCAACHKLYSAVRITGVVESEPDSPESAAEPYGEGVDYAPGDAPVGYRGPVAITDADVPDLDF